MKATCTVCNEPFERGVGQSRSKYCSTECRNESRKNRTNPTNGKSKGPQPYQKKDGNWYCTYQGKQHYLGNNLFKAHKKLEEVLRDDYVPSNGTSISLQAAIDQYLASIEHVQSHDTLKSKKSAYSRLLAYLGPRATLKSVDRDTIEKYKQHLFEKGLKKSSVRHTLVVLSALFDSFVKIGLVSRNPVKEIAAIKVKPDPDPDHLNTDEIDQLYALVRAQKSEFLVKRDELVFTLMLHAGLRKIEVCNLKWSDVDLDRNLLILRTTKGEKPRLIGINNTLRDALNHCWDSWKLSDEYVVTTRSGGQLSRDGLGWLAKKYVKKLNHHYQGKKRLSLHSLRASFATQLAGKGVGTRVIQGLLGHSDPKTTMRYTCYTEAMAVEAVKVLDA